MINIVIIMYVFLRFFLCFTTTLSAMPRQKYEDDLHDQK